MKKEVIIIIIIILAVAGYFVYDKYFGKSVVAAPMAGVVERVEANKIYLKLGVNYASNRDDQRGVEVEERVVVIGEGTELIRRILVDGQVQASSATILDLKAGTQVMVIAQQGHGQKEFLADRVEIVR